MSDYKELTLTRLKNTSFPSLYQKLLLNRPLTDKEKVTILSIAIVLTNQSDAYLKQLGYRIALTYGNNTNDHEPLFDISINNGLIPVSSSIKRDSELLETDFFSEFIQCYSQIYKKGSITYTEQQYLLNQFFLEKYNTSVSVIAPTSYGKSELILSLLNQRESNVCIIVPSKSLLGQIKKRILDANISWIKKIITHSDMYKPENNHSVFVLTQERLSKLMHKNKDLTFDLAIVDEAHNLLDNDDRNILLASTIHIIKYRNNKTAFKFLTPFLMDHTNLNLRHKNANIDNFKVTEYVKSGFLFLSDFRVNKNDHYLYDQFINEFIEHGEKFESHIDLILQKQLNKNLIYFNKPKNIEDFCLNFIEMLPDVKCDLINTACDEIEEYTHQHYRLIKCLKKGVVYHHGSIPDLIKPYLEHIYSKSKNIKYIITSSTLLEGVNLPIERLFILENKKGRNSLTASQLKNLIGRIARFNQIFNDSNKTNFSLLQPSIYLIGTEEYTSNKTNLKNFLQQKMKVDIKVSDDLTNTLLSNTPINEKNKSDLDNAESRLENLENGVLEGYQGDYVKTEIGMLLYANNVTEIDIFKYESEIKNKLEVYKNQLGLLSNVNQVMEVISECFINFVEDERLNRLKQDSAKRFYTMFLDWKVKNYPFKQMVASVIGYWESLSPEAGAYVYVGTWGDSKYGDSFLKLWTNIKNKTDEEKLNLAIVRIKEEEDFFDHCLFKFIEILNEYELIEDNLYLTIKYGTTDEQSIKFIREGFSKTLSDLLVTKYSNYFTFDNLGNISISSRLVENMQANEEKAMLIFETELNLATPPS